MHLCDIGFCKEAASIIRVALLFLACGFLWELSKGDESLEPMSLQGNSFSRARIRVHIYLSKHCYSLLLHTCRTGMPGMLTNLDKQSHCEPRRTSVEHFNEALANASTGLVRCGIL